MEKKDSRSSQKGFAGGAEGDVKMAMVGEIQVNWEYSKEDGSLEETRLIWN